MITSLHSMDSPFLLSSNSADDPHAPGGSQHIPGTFHATCMAPRKSNDLLLQEKPPETALQTLPPAHELCRHDRKNTNRQCCKYVINTFFNNPCQHFSILRVIIPFSSIGCNIKARRTRHLSGHQLPKVLRYSHYHRYVCFVMYRQEMDSLSKAIGGEGAHANATQDLLRYVEKVAMFPCIRRFSGIITGITAARILFAATSTIFIITQLFYSFTAGSSKIIIIFEVVIPLRLPLSTGW